MKATYKIWKVISFLVTLVSIAFLAWIFVSWMDIIADNCMPNPQHYPWNFFIVMFK